MVFSNFLWICIHQGQCSVFPRAFRIDPFLLGVGTLGEKKQQDKSHMICWHNNYTSPHQEEHQQWKILVPCELKAHSRDVSQGSVFGELIHTPKTPELSGSLPFAKLNLVSFLQCKELPSHKGVIVGIDICCNEGTPPVHLEMGKRLQ